MHHGVTPSTASVERCSTAKPCAIVKRCVICVSSPSAHVRYRSGITTFSGAFSPFSGGASPRVRRFRAAFIRAAARRRAFVVSRHNGATRGNWGPVFGLRRWLRPDKPSCRLRSSLSATTRQAVVVYNSPKILSLHINTLNLEPDTLV